MKQFGSSMFLLVFISNSILYSFEAMAQEKIYLWQDGAPMATGKTDKDQPYITVHVPKTQNKFHSAVIICPGGGYNMLADDHEGKQVAEWFNERGVAAFILYYRLGSSGYKHPVPLMDADRALKLVRSGAKKWHIAEDKIGIMGFSAGGHLSSTLATHFTDKNMQSKDTIDHVSSRPDFLILGYPVISFTAEFTHTGSRRAILGNVPDQQTAKDLSNELQVSNLTPPTFLLHTDEDSGVPSLNSVYFYIACKKAGVPAELHIYEKGKHGLGLINKDQPVFSTWADRLNDWLKIRNVVE